MSPNLSIDSSIASALGPSDRATAAVSHQMPGAHHDHDSVAFQAIYPPRAHFRDSQSSTPASRSRPVSVHTTESSTGNGYDDDFRFRTVG